MEKSHIESSFNISDNPVPSIGFFLLNLLNQTEAKGEEKGIAQALKDAAAQEKVARKARDAEAQSVKVSRIDWDSCDDEFGGLELSK